MYALNYTLLIAKYSIYCKCLHDEKCFDSFLSLLMEKVNIQREIAIQNNKLTKFTEIYGIVFVIIIFFVKHFIFVVSCFLSFPCKYDNIICTAYKINCNLRNLYTSEYLVQRYCLYVLCIVYCYCFL